MKKRRICCLFGGIILSVAGFMFSCNEEFRGGAVNVALLDSVFEKPLSVGVDSVNLSEYLSKMHTDAGSQQQDYLLWAYYLRLADDHMLQSAETNTHSTYYFQKAKAIANKIDRPETDMGTCIQYGHYLFTHNKVAEAIPYYVQAANLLEKADLKQVPHLAEQMIHMADFFSYVGDQQQAVAILSKVIPYSRAGSKQQMAIYNAIGGHLQHAQKVEEATIYFLKALTTAQQSKDSLQMAISLYHIGDLKFQKGELQKAKSYLLWATDYAASHKDQLLTLYTSLALARVYIQEGEYARAKPIVSTALAQMEDDAQFLDFKLQIAELKSQMAKYDGDSAEELIQLNRLAVLREAVSKRDAVDQLQQSHWVWRAEQYKDTLNLKEEMHKQSILYKQYGYLAICLFAGAGLLVIARFQHARRRNKALLRANATKHENEDREKDVEMQLLKGAVDEFSNALKLNNVKLEALMEVSPKDYPIDSFESFDYLLDSHLMSDAKWLKFKTIFDRVHHGYLDRLKEQHAHLTEADLRIIALQKLEFSNRGIGDLLGISVDGVKKAKQRLKKKLETEKV